MHIDWVTVVAQIINFLVLVYLLKRFLYQPIVSAMDKRARNIAASLQEAQDKAAMADQEAQDYRDMSAALEAERHATLAQAKEEAEAYKAQLLDTVREEIAQTRQRWLEEVARDQETQLREVRQAVSQQVFQVTRQALAGLANAELEEQVIRAFMARLENLSTEDKQVFTAALVQERQALRVSSSFEIPAPLRDELTRLLQAQFGSETKLHFEHSDELLCGIALHIPGHKLLWSLDSYLGDVEEQMSQLLTTPVTPQATGLTG
jgi:F-type H+-transporting ATPase subunit b